MFVAKDYKQLLLALECEGVIEAVDAATGKTVRSSRVKRAGMAALGDGYLMRRRAQRK